MTPWIATRQIVRTRALKAGLAFACLVWVPHLAGRAVQQSTPVRQAASKPIFQSEQGPPRASDVAFDRQTRAVTVRFSVQDPNGNFIPNLRLSNFVVYEDGIQQHNATVEIERVPVTLAVLLEGGGRYQEFNKILSGEIPRITNPLIDELGRADRIAVFSYSNMVQTVADFQPPSGGLEDLFSKSFAPGLSDANLHDALVDVWGRLQSKPDRKALLLISSGIDTSSHASFSDVLAAAQHADAPAYCIGLSDLVRRTIDTADSLSKIDWNDNNERLKTLATASGGRTYLLDTTPDIPGVYGAIMENLRERYVIAYESPNPAGGRARTVRVEVVDPATGAPLRIVDANGSPIAARISAQAAYTP
jgi:VWFA-related protein